MRFISKKDTSLKIIIIYILKGMLELFIWYSKYTPHIIIPRTAGQAS